MTEMTEMPDTTTEMTEEERQQAEDEYEAAIRAFNQARDALDEAWRIGDMSPSPEAWKALAAMDEPRARLLAARARHSAAGQVPATEPATQLATEPVTEPAG